MFLLRLLAAGLVFHPQGEGEVGAEAVVEGGGGNLHHVCLAVERVDLIALFPVVLRQLGGAMRCNGGGVGQQVYTACGGTWREETSRSPGVDYPWRTASILVLIIHGNLLTVVVSVNHETNITLGDNTQKYKGVDIYI